MEDSNTHSFSVGEKSRVILIYFVEINPYIVRDGCNSFSFVVGGLGGGGRGESLFATYKTLGFANSFNEYASNSGEILFINMSL